MDFNQLLRGDCIEGLGRLEAESVDLVFADPPFNIGYKYDVYKDRHGYRQYLDWSKSWGEAVRRVLKPHGTFWLAIGDEYAAELKLLFQNDLGFVCRSWVVWYYTFGVHCTKKFTRSHAHLFYFVKDGKHFTFNGPEIKVPSARQLVYHDSRADERGRIPDDTWILRPQDLPEGWQRDEDSLVLGRVRHFQGRAGLARCQMPEQLLGRIIKVCSNPGDLCLIRSPEAAPHWSSPKNWAAAAEASSCRPLHASSGTTRCAKVGQPLPEGPGGTQVRLRGFSDAEGVAAQKTLTDLPAVSLWTNRSESAIIGLSMPPCSRPPYRNPQQSPAHHLFQLIQRPCRRAAVQHAVVEVDRTSSDPSAPRTP